MNLLSHTHTSWHPHIRWECQMIFEKSHTFLVISVLWVISCFEQNSMFRKLNVFCLVFDVEKIQLYHRKGHKMINSRKRLEKLLGDSNNAKKKLINPNLLFQILVWYNVVSLQPRYFVVSTICFPRNHLFYCTWKKNWATCSWLIVLFSQIIA